MHEQSTRERPANDCVDPPVVPQRRLYTGARMPSIGTFGSDQVSPDELAEAVKIAAAVGYRHFGADPFHQVADLHLRQETFFGWPAWLGGSPAAPIPPARAGELSSMLAGSAFIVHPSSFCAS